MNIIQIYIQNTHTNKNKKVQDTHLFLYLVIPMTL